MKLEILNLISLDSISYAIRRCLAHRVAFNAEQSSDIVKHIRVTFSANFPIASFSPPKSQIFTSFLTSATFHTSSALKLYGRKARVYSLPDLSTSSQDPGFGATLRVSLNKNERSPRLQFEKQPIMCKCCVDLTIHSR